MRERIEQLLKTRIGTGFVYDNSRDYPIIKLTGYGANILITYDNVALDKSFVKVIYPAHETFTVLIAQDHSNLDELLVASVKMMIEVRKKESK